VAAAGGGGGGNQEAKKKKKRVKITRDWSYCISVAMQRRDCTRTKGEKEVSAGRVGGEGVLRVHVILLTHAAMVAKLPVCKVCSKADSGRYSCPVDHIP
jgi:hypothetical protein